MKYRKISKHEQIGEFKVQYGQKYMLLVTYDTMKTRQNNLNKHTTIYTDNNSTTTVLAFLFWPE